MNSMREVEFFDIGPDRVKIAFYEVREVASGKIVSQCQMDDTYQGGALTVNAVYPWYRRDDLHPRRRSNAIAKNSKDVARVLQKMVGSR